MQISKQRVGGMEKECMGVWIAMEGFPMHVNVPHRLEREPCSVGCLFAPVRVVDVSPVAVHIERATIITYGR